MSFLTRMPPSEFEIDFLHAPPRLSADTSAMCMCSRVRCTSPPCRESACGRPAGLAGLLCVSWVFVQS